MTAQQKLNAVLVDWDKAAEAFERAVQDAARASVAWERFAARRRIQLKASVAASGEKLTVADLDAQILVDDEQGLYDQREIAEAVVTGLRKRLDVFSAQADAARSEIASERKRAEAWGASPSVPQWSGEQR